MHEITDLDREELEGRTVACSISGGKDSTAMALWLIEQGIEAVYAVAAACVAWWVWLRIVDTPYGGE